MTPNRLQELAPAVPTPLDEIVAALDRIGPLHGLSVVEREWLARNGSELYIKAGGVFFEEGTPAEHMLLILKGEIHVRRTKEGPVSLFIGRAGQMTGMLPFSRMKTYGGQGYAVQDVWALGVHKSRFPAMLEAIPTFTQRVISTLLDRVREVTRIEQQAEKLNALGKLAGNLAHELNNPASAAQRAAGSLHDSLKHYRKNRFRLVALCLQPEQVRRIEAWENGILARLGDDPAPRANPFPNADPLAVAAREESLLKWLDRHKVQDAWKIAPELAELGVPVAELEPLSQFLSSGEMSVVLDQFAAGRRAQHFVGTMLESTDRIFDLISAIKTYSYMDRPQLLEVDVQAGLDATVQMLQARIAKVAAEITVQREYQPGLPKITAYGSELNQVWTALIDNSIDALARSNEPGCLRLVCRTEADMVLVEVWDNGPGIPDSLKDRIFEPFFTTKAPGQGLGLSLDNATRIVRKHRGHISVRSEPGSTCFRVRLPLEQVQAY